jgi:hypothetical protein
VSPAEVLAQAESRGVTLGTESGQVHFRTRDGRPLPRDLAEEIQRHKATILRLLSEPSPSAPCRACHQFMWWQSPSGKWTCGLCHPPRDPRSVVRVLPGEDPRQLVAGWPQDDRQAWQERITIRKHESNIPRPVAGRLAVGGACAPD